MSLGMLFGIAGAGIGVLGGLIGTYYSLKNVKNAEESALIMKFSAAVWILVTSFLAGVLLLPSPYSHLLWLPYGFLLHFAIRKFNAAQKRIHDDAIVGTR